MASTHSNPAMALMSAEQDQRVVALKRQGLTFLQIASELAISKSQAHRAFQRALNRIPADDVRAYREEQLEHIELAREVVLDVLSSYTENLLVSREGDVIEAGEDFTSVLGAVDRLVKLDDHEAKLLGLYAATRISVDAEQAAERIKALLRRAADEPDADEQP